jgi:hypothetical protein
MGSVRRTRRERSSCVHVRLPAVRIGHYRQAVQLLTELAMQTDKGIVLAKP